MPLLVRITFLLESNVVLTGDELSERVFGAFIVKQSKRREPHAAIYDHDETLHTLLVEYTISQNSIDGMRINGNTMNTVN